MIDAQYIAHFVESVRGVFSSMIQLEVRFESPTLRTMAPSYDITGLIGMSGDVVGSVALRMSEPVAKAVVGKFAGLSCSIDSPDFVDAIGELVNMVSGAAKAKFVGKNVSISTPSVVVGAGHKIACPAKTICVSLPCVLECGHFSLDIAIREEGVAKAA